MIKTVLSELKPFRSDYLIKKSTQILNRLIFSFQLRRKIFCLYLYFLRYRIL
jgi:hypothetical protein